MHGLEVIAYRHYDLATKLKAYKLFINMCGLFHLNPEDASEFEDRLSQVVWSKNIPQPNDYEEALMVLREGSILSDIFDNK
jgi:hypothetical protein